MKTVLLRAMLFGLGVTALAGAAQAHDLSQDEALRLSKEGVIRPFEEILPLLGHRRGLGQFRGEDAADAPRFLRDKGADFKLALDHHPGQRRYRRGAVEAGDPGSAVGMIPTGVKVFVASHPVDFRKGPDSLLSLVRDAGSDPFNGSLYVFRAKRADRVKIVWWDGSGVCLYSKRLEKAQFCWPRIGHNRVQLNHAQLMALVDGMDWKRVRSVAVKPPEIVG